MSGGQCMGIVCDIRQCVMSGGEFMGVVFDVRW